MKTLRTLLIVAGVALATHTAALAGKPRLTDAIAERPVSAAETDDIAAAPAIDLLNLILGTSDSNDDDPERRDARIVGRTLYIFGSAAGESLVLRLETGVPRRLGVDFDDDGVSEFQFDPSQFDRITADARDGDDRLVIDESGGAFTDTKATTLIGGKGADTIFGGSGGERIIGGPGSDAIFAGAGDDRIIWRPGDSSDKIDGAEGFDTVEINGNGTGEQFTITANGSRVRFDRADPDAFSLDIGTSESLYLKANGGDDSLACTGNLAALIQITADGGPGDDALLGSNGADHLLGGAGDDFLDGNQGTDALEPGDGDDVVQWDPGDGSDLIDGGDGHDVIRFNGSNIGELLEFTAVGQRVRFARNIGNIVLDIDGVEQFDLRALGGADTITVHDLTAAALDTINVDLSSSAGEADASADTVAIAGTASPDTFEISRDGDFVAAKLSATVRVRGYEGLDQILIDGIGGDIVNINGSDESDTISIVANGSQARIDIQGASIGVGVTGAASIVANGGGGADTISCTGNLAGLGIPLTLDGGPGDDTLLGSNAADHLVGGPGADFIDGNQGADVAEMGAGDDTFQWDPGDGSDAVEGNGGQDAIRFNGSNIAESLDFSAQDGHLLFTRNIGNVALDAHGVERFDLQALGGADAITVNDLTGVGLDTLNIQLAGTFGGDAGDGQSDLITVNGTNGNDAIDLAAESNSLVISGLTAKIRIATAEAASDRLAVNGLAGRDAITLHDGVDELIVLLLHP